MKHYIHAAMAMLCAGLLSVGCTGSFDEINTDPDKALAEDVPMGNVLAFCERYASSGLYDIWFDMNECSGFSGQVAKMMYTAEGYYDFRSEANTNSWNICYTVVSNLQAILDHEPETSCMWAAATIFQCQMYQIMSDRWGNIPYSDALHLSEGNATPKYDEQSAIYLDLLQRLGRAVAVLEARSESNVLGSGDVLFSGHADQRVAWVKYGNALRLRIAARLANVSPDLARATFEAVTADGILPEDNDDNAFFIWNNEYPEPWADKNLTRPNDYCVSELMVNTLTMLDDPRLSVYCAPTRIWQSWAATHEGEEPAKYVGRQCGLRPNANVRAFSLIGERFADTSGSLMGFSPWLRSCEVYFALAYAASKGWQVGMSQQEAYERAVALSLDENGFQSGDYLTTGQGAYDGTIDQLFTQWWISLFKNGSEAWSVYRMAPTDTYLFRENKVAPDNVWGPSHNCPPMCYGYPDTERNLNTDNCQAYKENDYFWGKQMWWDTREGLK